MTKVIHNYDEIVYGLCDDDRKYLIEEKDVQQFQSRFKNGEDAIDILEDMDIGFITNDYITKDKKGDIVFLCSEEQYHGYDREYDFDYVYSDYDEELFTSQDYYETKESGDAIYIKHSNDGSSYEKIDNPFGFEYSDKEVLIPIGYPKPYNPKVMAYFTEDEMVIEITPNYSEETEEVITLDTFLNDYDNLKEEALKSEVAKELTKRDDVPEEFKKAVQSLIGSMFQTLKKNILKN